MTSRLHFESLSHPQRPQSIVPRRKNLSSSSDKSRRPFQNRIRIFSPFGNPGS